MSSQTDSVKNFLAHTRDEFQEMADGAARALSEVNRLSSSYDYNHDSLVVLTANRIQNLAYAEQMNALLEQDSNLSAEAHLLLSQATAIINTLYEPKGE